MDYRWPRPQLLASAWRRSRARPRARGVLSTCPRACAPVSRPRSREAEPRSSPAEQLSTRPPAARPAVGLRSAAPRPQRACWAVRRAARRVRAVSSPRPVSELSVVMGRLLRLVREGLKARVCAVTVRTQVIPYSATFESFRVVRGSALTHAARAAPSRTACVVYNSDKAPSVLKVVGERGTTRVCAATAFILHFIRAAASLAREQHSPPARQKARKLTPQGQRRRQSKRRR